MPGQQLLLNQARPFMSVMSTYTSVYEEEVPYEVEEIKTSTYVKGYRMPSVKGQPGLQRVTAAISTVNGVEVSREILDRVLLRAPVTEKVIVGTNDPRNIVSSGARVNSSGFMWPTQGGVINVGLGGYPGHTGVDIPRPAGTPIFAAAAGRVVRVVHSGVGYGRYVIIDHGNGFSTLYAHASAIHVTVGQYVNQGCDRLCRPYRQLYHVTTSTLRCGTKVDYESQLYRLAFKKRRSLCSFAFFY